MAAKPVYITQIEQWKRELAAELKRDVTFEEIAEATGLAYGTLMKHAAHQYKRPDYITATLVCGFFNDRSRTKRTPQDYFVEVSEDPELVAVAAY